MIQLMFAIREKLVHGLMVVVIWGPECWLGYRTISFLAVQVVHPAELGVATV